MQNTKIGWTHHTWNPWWGCNKVSPGCHHCYIGQIMRRSGREPFDGPMRTKTTWKNPKRWNRKATQNGERLRVFTCSMSDFFHPGADAWRDEAWEIIRACTNLDWLILTKRPDLIPDRLPSDWENGYSNVWLGVTVEDQAQIKRVDLLTKIPAAIRFVSAEPLLGARVLANWKEIQKILDANPYALNPGPVRASTPRMAGLYPGYPARKWKPRSKTKRPQDLDLD